MGSANSISPHRTRKVCVVGAGVSGLRASGLLSAAGFEVTILEARDRIGGRIHQDTRFGQPVDLGASWIHGTEDNPIVDLAKETNSTTVACGAVYSICDPNGAWLSREKAKRYYEEVWDILELAMEKSRANATLIAGSTKMMDFIRLEIQDRRLRGICEERDAVLMTQIVEMWGAFMGDDCERQSLKNLWLDAGLEGDNLFVASTYKDILTDLYQQLSNTTTIRLGCEVTEITNVSTGNVCVKAADSFQAEFEDVIVTAPLGWLKRNEHVFSPTLPSRLSTAIHSIGYGNLEKIFIKFPVAFWNDRDEKTTDPGKKSMTESIQDPAFPIESLFLQPEYAMDTNPAKWRTEIISYSGLPDQFSQPVIMFFVYGQWGRHICGLVRDMAQDSEEYYKILNDIFRPYYSKLPHYDDALPGCKPGEFMSTDWQNDKFAGYGSFANMPVGSGDCEQHFQTLREGMGEERGIWFAGEHTSPPGGLGTVTGLIGVGRRSRKELLAVVESR